LRLFLNTAQYEEACATYLTVVNHKRYKQLNSTAQEEWKIYRAYLEFLNLSGVMSANLRAEKSTFRTQKFINEVTIFDKDKSGMNVAILMVQLLLLIAKQKFNKVIDRMEAVEKYVARHLKTDYHYRSRCFIQIIRLFFAAGFNTRMIDWEAVQKLQQKIADRPVELAQPNYDVEVIPYDNLIPIVIQLLRQHQ
jgi:hypothetical protein